MAKRQKDRTTKNSLPRQHGADVASATRREGRAFWFGVVGTWLAAVTVATSAIYFVFDARNEQIKRDCDERNRAVELDLGGSKQLIKVSDILVPASDIPTMPPSTARFDLPSGMLFFVADYPGAPWTHQSSNELEVTELMVGRDQVLIDVPTREEREALRESEVYLFRHPDDYAIDLTKRRRSEDAAPRLYLSPMILVEARPNVTLGDSIGAPPEARNEVRRLLATRSRTKDPLETYTVEQRIATALDDMFRADIAGTVLAAVVNGDRDYVVDYSGVQYKLLSVQKRGNTLALQSQLVFVNVQLEGKRDSQTIVVDQVVWFLASTEQSFIVRAFVPKLATDLDRHDEWIRRWFRGFQFVW